MVSMDHDEHHFESSEDRNDSSTLDQVNSSSLAASDDSQSSAILSEHSGESDDSGSVKSRVYHVEDLLGMKDEQQKNPHQALKFNRDAPQSKFFAVRSHTLCGVLVWLLHHQPMISLR